MESEGREMLGINPILGHDNKDRKLDIIFIHGLNGHAIETWREGKETFWPYWLGEEFTDTAVWSIGYDATPSAWLGDTMPMEDRAFNMLNDLSNTDSIGTRPIFFIVHSMGGLILKYILEKSNVDNDYTSIIQQTKGVAFLATPHEGSAGANFLTSLGIILRVGDIVKQLQKNASSLNRLDDVFNTIVRQKDLKCFSFYETKEIRIKNKYFGWKGIKVVSESSAKGRFSQPTPLPVDRDHLDICKLQSKSDLVYRNIKRLISEALDEISTVNNSKNDVDKKYIDIENSLPDPIQNEAPSSINQIFLIFNNDDTSDKKYEVIGYIQADNEFENELIEFTFEDIYDAKEQEAFLEKLIKEAELDDVPIHFILPPSLFLVNFKQWKYKDNEFVKLYHVLLHNKEKFLRKIGKYQPMIDKWNSLFEQLKDDNITDALLVIENSEERFDARDKKIGICFKYTPIHYDSIKDTLIATDMGLWQYPNGIMTDYHTWLDSGIYLNQLNQDSRKCDYMALLWDDMSLLEKLKRRI